MAQVTLTKRNYLGVGYFHMFRDDKTDAIIYQECTQEEYERMGQKGGSQFNPVLEGHTWVQSFGGSFKVDSPDGTLGKNEYTEIGNEAHIMLDTKNIKDAYMVKPKTQVVGDKVLVDDTLLKSFEPLPGEPLIP